MKEYKKEQILEIANYQIKIIFLMVYCILLNGLALRFFVLSFLLSGFLAYFMLKLAKALDLKLAFIFAILAFIPIVSIISLIVLNQMATKALFHAGLRVTFFGADKNELERYNNSKVWGSAKEK